MCACVCMCQRERYEGRERERERERERVRERERESEREKEGERGREREPFLSLSRSNVHLHPDAIPLRLPLPSLRTGSKPLVPVGVTGGVSSPSKIPHMKPKSSRTTPRPPSASSLSPPSPVRALSGGVVGSCFVDISDSCE